MNQEQLKENKIKFGTDGWRALIAKEFTFDNVRLVTQALVDYLKDKNLGASGIAVGYDHRFQSEHFARAAAEICSGAGLKTYLMTHAVPTPVLSFTVKHLGLAAGIMITASHNPPEWNGFKIKEAFGGSAFPETTHEVETRLPTQLRIKPGSTNIQMWEPDPPYFQHLKTLVDLELLASRQLNIIIDPMFGSGSNYFTKLGVKVREIRNRRDPLFGGINPEPLPINLVEAISFVQESALKHPQELTAGIVLDGDADRLAAIDGSGRFLNTHSIFTLLLRQLVVHRQLHGKVIKTFNLTGLIDKLCQHYQLPLSVTPIGFKHIAKQMMTGEVLLGGEESGGMGIKGNIPERDGILAGLFLLELMVKERKSLAQILEEQMDEFGHYYYDRIDRHTTQGPALVKSLMEKQPQQFAGQKVAKIETLDGLKLYFNDESWILFRASGTEPLLRIYCEGRSPEAVKLLLGAGEQLV